MADNPELAPGDRTSVKARLGDEELGVLKRLRREGDWTALKKNCSEALRDNAPDLRVALFWAEANTNLTEFRGLAEGIRQVTRLWSQLAKESWQFNDDSDNWLEVAADALESCLLQVPLVRGTPITFTTVINSRRDPELASEVQRDVEDYVRWSLLRDELQMVESALLEFEGLIGPKSRQAFGQLKRTMADMLHTVSAWATAKTETEAIPAEAAPPATEPDYVIHLWIEDVAGESTAPYHNQWIAGISYKQSLRRPTGEDEASQPAFEIEKYLDQTSPSLYHAVHSGRVFGTVIIEVCRGTDQAERFLRIQMSDAVINEVRQSAASSSGISRPVETVVFAYRRIQWTYTKLRQPDALREGNTSSTWTRPTPGSEANRTPAQTTDYRFNRYWRGWITP